MSKSENTVAKLILQQLEAWGVKRIYGVVGDAILGLMDELNQQKAIQFIAVKHESVAGMMASAEAKLTGKIGVCTSTMGPGVANLLNGLGDAHMDKAPVLAITGQAPTNKIGTDYKQYIDQQELVKPFASFTSLVSHPDAITDLLIKAMHTSLSNGSVSHLSVPKDLFTSISNAKVREQPTFVRGMSTIQEDQLVDVIKEMKEAKSPIILAGIGAKNSVDLVDQLSTKWGAGILVSLGAKGYFDDSIQLLMGGIGQGGNPYAEDLFKSADVVLVVGDTWWPEGYVPKDVTVIQIDQAEVNIGKEIPTKYGVVGGASEILTHLLKSIPSEQEDSKWISQVVDIKNKWEKENDEERNNQDVPIHPSRIVKSIEEVIEKDAILSIDTGDVTVWMNRNFKPTNQQFLFSGKWRTMGYGLPGALAAKLCYPEKQVLAIVGDGGIEMVLADLLTATRYELNITVIVFNNHALQMERDKMIVGGYAQEGVDLTNPDFVKIAQACGLKAYRISDNQQLKHILVEAVNENSPTLVTIDTAAIVHPETKESK
ncbi:thiamine pyrophosphate-binding protein [Litchfieldia salsa]|uniref:Pyruvate dehydrogenase (Quinone)/pyruvate oxidase n=1 Tax=Litchfieldia salsa TaxID=930152 RepID=A0A1H0TEA1_9BACI|nr:thiamine pyrophosphate-binding protein [Litchfieldia salsa]SDP51918.1 pyruvate dehydrogenase (quinone)/pyruvate oxidase [Litchfieldia salsa]